MEAGDLLGTTCTGLVVGGLKKAANIPHGAVRSNPTAKYGELAKVLTEQGSARDARIQAIVDALDGRGTLSRPELTTLGAAIGANTYLRDRGRRK